MWTHRLSGAMYGMLTPFSKILIFLGGFCLLAMMLLTAFDVAMRYFFDNPIDGAYDATEYMMVIVFAFALPYCTLQKGHVRVDILTERLPKRVNYFLDCVTTLISLALFTTVAWQILLSMKIQFDSKIVSAVLLIPRYPFYGLLFIGYLCFVVILLAELLARIAEVKIK